MSADRKNTESKKRKPRGRGNNGTQGGCQTKASGSKKRQHRYVKTQVSNWHGSQNLKELAIPTEAQMLSAAIRVSRDSIFLAKTLLRELRGKIEWLDGRYTYEMLDELTKRGAFSLIDEEDRQYKISDLGYRMAKMCSA